MPINAAKQKLQDQLGKETFVGEWFTIDQERIDRFAEATGASAVDSHRSGKQSPFGSTVAHGFLTLSLLPCLTKSINPDQPMFEDQKMAINYGLNKVRFPHPVKMGSQVRARTELVAFEAESK